MAEPQTDAVRQYDMGPSGAGRRLHLNEFRFVHDARVEGALRGAAADCPASTLLSEYPQGAPPALLSDLADYAGVPGPDWVAVSAGSDEALRAAIDSCGLRGQKAVVVGVPTYTHFTTYARIRGLRIYEYQLGLGTAPAVQRTILELYRGILAEGALVYLGSPNNPTGDVWGAEDVRALSETYPASTFLVDEAYTEFAGAALASRVFDVSGDKLREKAIEAIRAGEAGGHGEGGGGDGGGGDGGGGDQLSREHLRMRSIVAGEALNGCSVAPLVADCPNVIVTRTFSKAFGLAALRVGYAVARPAAIRQLKLVLSPKALGHLATLAAGELVHSCLPHYLAMAREALAEAQALRAKLAAEGWWVKAPAGATNFFLVYVGDVPAATAHLLRKKIFVRDRDGHPSLGGFIRISAGTAWDNDCVLAALKELAPPPPPRVQLSYTPKAAVAEIRRLLAETWGVLARRGVGAWLEAGTLLGAVRHGGLIPWDDDADLGYTFGGAAEDPVAALGPAFRARGLVLQRNRTGAYWQVGTNREGEAISARHVDLFPFHPGPEGSYRNADPRFRDPAPHGGDCNSVYASAGELFPLRDCGFYHRTYKIPRKAEAVLARALGGGFMAAARIRLPGGGFHDFGLRDRSPA